MMSDTPQSIDAFIAWKVVVHLAEFLAEIRKTAGFNTDPSVHIDFNEWADTPAKYSILLEVAVKVQGVVTSAAIKDQGREVGVRQVGQFHIRSARFITEHRHLGRVRCGERNFYIGCAILDSRSDASESG